MMNVYGSRVVNGWGERLETEALARYVRGEYGPGTRVDYLYAEMAAAAPRAGGRRSRGFVEALRSVTRAWRAMRSREAGAARDAKDSAAPTDG